MPLIIFRIDLNSLTDIKIRRKNKQDSVAYQKPFFALMT